MNKKIFIIASFPPNSPGGSWPIIEQLLKDYPTDLLYWWYYGMPLKKDAERYCKTVPFCTEYKFLLHGKRFRRVRALLNRIFIEPLGTNHLLKAINKFNPDVILAIPYQGSIPIIFNVLNRLKSKRINHKPTVHVSVHDMADTRDSVSRLGSKVAMRYQLLLESIYQIADTTDCVTEEIGEYLGGVTGKLPNLKIMYGAEQEQIDRLRCKEVKSLTNSFSIGYAGTIITQNTFNIFISAIRILNVEYGFDVRLHLFSSHPYDKYPWFDHKLITLEGFLSGDEFRKKYSSMNYALCMMHLDDSDIRYSSYSIPCKLTKSMAEGVPLLCLAGRDTTVYRMISRYQAGFYSDESDPKLLACKLRDFFLCDKIGHYTNQQMATLLSTECHAGRNRRLLMELLSINDS